ncbi:MAG: hydantoinase/oxoprolinase family protein [Acidimicrobiia bacterium]|nr:hydantoinase/oxoprolinase family protein [Acidimicrobiia bacterium]
MTVDSPSLRVAVDIGGTFTDLVLVADEQVIRTGKVLTTPNDPSQAVADGIHQLLGNLDYAAVTEIVHGTTLVSNALIERKGAVTALITTEGFRDVLESGREQRYDLYDLFLEMPSPLVPRRRRMGLRERILADGSIDTPLDVDDVRALVSTIDDDVTAVAVCLLHSYRNSAHEEIVRDVLNEMSPETSVAISSEVSPEVGEYERVSTTAANAYGLPVVDRYLGTLEQRLDASGIKAPIRIMLSTGGLASTEVARRFPVRLLESGPAAGVLSAGYLGGADTNRPVLAFDMGGTTAKAALIEDGEPLLASEMEAARVYRFTRGSGLPIRVPVMDMIEIGAGGGSIARVGTFGLPKVGPDSASSDPGPVAYGLGGESPTVTDADLVLGYLDPDYFLGGSMRLDLDKAREALGALGTAMGLDAEETAAAVHRVVNENMASAARMHAIEAGRDIRRYTLVATGGAGPVHAWGVARALGLNSLIFPPRAGVASAFGMLTAPTSFEFARSLPAPLAETRWKEVDDVLGLMEEEGRHQLTLSNVEAVEVLVSADVRYEGQGEAITIELGSELESDPAAHVRRRFEEEYLVLYGSHPTDVDPEVLTWRLRVAGDRPAPDIAADVGTRDSEALRGHRRMWFSETDQFVDCAVFDRYALPPGFRLEGPAVVEERESTVVIGPGGSATISDNGTIEVEIE